MKISFFKIMNYLLKNDIKDVYFVDSYGGIINFFNLFNELNNKKNFVIFCSNIELYKFLSSLDIFKKKIFYYSYKKSSLINYINVIFYIPFNFFFTKVERIICYKFITDPFRFILINLISSSKTKIFISDQFYKSYDFASHLSKNYGSLKKVIISFINLFCIVKIHLYRHLDLEYCFYPSIDKKYGFKCKMNSWYFYKKKFFKKKYNIKKNSLIIIDETINILIKKNWLDVEYFHKNFNLKFSKFLKQKKIKNIYYKGHPTTKMNSFVLDQIDKSKIKFLDANFPIEYVLNDFNYCIFSISSSIFYTKKVKLYHLTNLLKFKKKRYKKNYEMLLKKNSGKNYSKLITI
jgi:hypothetical protein